MEGVLETQAPPSYGSGRCADLGFSGSGFHSPLWMLCLPTSCLLVHCFSKPPGSIPESTQRSFMGSREPCMCPEEPWRSSAIEYVLHYGAVTFRDYSGLQMHQHTLVVKRALSESSSYLQQYRKCTYWGCPLAIPLDSQKKSFLHSKTCPQAEPVGKGTHLTSSWTRQKICTTLTS